MDEYAIAWVLPTLLSLRALSAVNGGQKEVAERFADRAVQANKPDTEFGFLTAWRCGSVYESIGRLDDAADQFEAAFTLLESNLEESTRPWRCRPGTSPSWLRSSRTTSVSIRVSST